MNRLRLHGTQFFLGLLLALTLWTYVSFTTNPTATDEVITPVDAVGRAEDLVVVDPGTGLPETFSAATTLTISGPRLEINRLSSNDFQATVNLGGLGPGVHQLPIAVAAPPSVRIRSKQPSEITVRLARELTSTVPITVTPQGQPPFSFSAGEITPGAREAVIRGPEELVRRVAGVVAEVDLQGQTRDLSTTVPLQPMDAMGNPVEGVTVSPEHVLVQVPIVAQVEVQQVSVVPAFTGQPAPGYGTGAIDWDPKIVRVFTSGDITGTLSTEPIDLTGLTDGIITRTVPLRQVPNIITQPRDVQIRVRVEIVPITVTSQLPLIRPVSPTGLSAGLIPTADPPAIQITLAGPFDQLSQLNSDEVVPTVDLSGLGPGSYVLPVEIAVPDGLQVVSPTDPKVTVTIRPAPTP
ncbi:MAG: CdaR family protein, partial [Chloroflexota bacterium]|nr:CdaR family protein [Chloroflexota bacterium]